MNGFDEYDCVHDWRELSHRPEGLEELRVLFYCTKCCTVAAGFVPDDLLNTYEIKEDTDVSDDDLINTI